MSSHPRVLNKRHDKIPDDAILIDRTTEWGNPFKLTKEENRLQVIEEYKRWLLTQPKLVQKARTELKGKSLTCWCSPKACHGDVLFSISNGAPFFFSEPPDYNPHHDSHTHINIYSKSTSQLGRDLSHFSRYGFEHPEYGKFASMEGYWYWMKTGQKHDSLRNAVGFHAKQSGKGYPRIEMPGNRFVREMEAAILLRFDQNPDLKHRFLQSTLPFQHYYPYGQGQKVYKKHDRTAEWVVHYYTYLRAKLLGLNNGTHYKAIIAGSRDIEDYQQLCLLLESLTINISEVVCGMARGVDLLGKQWADRRFIDVKPFPVTKDDWDTYGKRAGNLRNTKMANYGEILIAVWDGASSGTQDMITTMRKLGKPTYVWRTDIGVLDGL